MWGATCWYFPFLLQELVNAFVDEEDKDDSNGLCWTKAIDFLSSVTKNNAVSVSRTVVMIFVRVD